MTTSTQVPFVDYLVLGDSPHLVAHECTNCGARFFDRRNACASCFASDFRDVEVATEFGGCVGCGVQAEAVPPPPWS